MDDNFGDTSYFASTDYNQRLEEKAESIYETKTSNIEDTVINKYDNSLDSSIANRNLSELLKYASSKLTEEEYLKLIQLNDKDILIHLSRNTNISNIIAEKLIGTVYLVHKELMQNIVVSIDIKDKLVNFMRTKYNIYSELIEKYEKENYATK
ncbi:MAG: hypothetical protein AB7D34_08010 [Sulfurimonas sp.]